MPKHRLDLRLLALGLTPSREQARRLIMAGEVRVNGETVDRPAVNVTEEAVIELKTKPRFASRGGEKLEAALTAFPIEITNLVCADVGASTGGFTDCLLQRGAAKVYAVDVGHGILDYRLRTNPRVVVLENTNARYLARLPEAVSFISIDVSFISLKIILPVVTHWFSITQSPNHPITQSLVCLIKPQFEAGRHDVGKGGVVKDPAIHRRVLEEVLSFAAALEWPAHGLLLSPLKGPAGNVEFLAWLRPSPSAALGAELIDRVMLETHPYLSPSVEEPV